MCSPQHFKQWGDIMKIDNLDIDHNIRHLNNLEIASHGVKQSSLKTEKVEWLTSKEAAEFLRVSEGTLRNMASNGKIPYSKLGRSNRYSRQELHSLLLSNKRGVWNGD